MKNLKNKTLMTIIAATMAISPVFADGLVFEPDSYPVAKADTQATTYKQGESVYVAAPSTVNTKTVTDVKNQVTRENNNMQDALFKLDSAQTDLRNQLIQDKAKYTDIDNQYKAIKEQRKIQRSLVREGERKINQIEKNKKQIRKLMQVAE